MGEEILFHKMANRSKEGCVTWGAPWPEAKVLSDDGFELIDANGRNIPMQTRITAFWPDGSVKWTTHDAYLSEEQNSIIVRSYKNEDDILKKQVSKEKITIEDNKNNIVVDAGKVKAIINKSGRKVIESLIINGRCSANYGELVSILERRILEENCITKKENLCIGEIKKAVIEEFGALKCVIKLEGIHKEKDADREIFPFVLRIIFKYNCNEIKIMHTFLYDGDEQKDFLKGMGIRFYCPLEGKLYNRHVKIGTDYGYFHESLQMLLSWRPKIPQDIYKNQLEGKNLCFEGEEKALVQKAIDDITIWSNYHIRQDSSRHFVIKKRTGKEDCCYLDSLHGTRTDGTIAFSGEDGGIVLGMKDFWEKYPSGYWLDGLDEKCAVATVWIWSPEVEAMDFRHYDTIAHSQAYYEGFDEFGATPYGIANTNEIVIKGFSSSILSDEDLDIFTKSVQKPMVVIADPKYYHDLHVFGRWSLPKNETSFQGWIEDQLDKAIDFYKNEIDERNWYGLFNYGDVMHTYDKMRHCWRYDMGGYAWQNTELVPTIWLWYAFLRTEREDIFTLAEAMTRHCSEVDIYHFGPYKGIGSRHNVSHWGCPCKEPRIAMAAHHRFYYYLTGFNRLGDVFDDVKDADFSTLNIDPLRYFYDKKEMVYPTHARSGPDWSSYCANWLTEWERHKNNQYKDKIITGIEDLKKMPLKLVSGCNFEYDPKTNHLRYIGENSSGGSHLQICQGAAEIWLEMVDLFNDTEWNKMLANYGYFYYLPPELKEKVSKGRVGKGGYAYPYMAAAMAAFSASYYKNKNLGHLVWKHLVEALTNEGDGTGFSISKVKDVGNKEQLNEIPWISTNFVSQWCLNSIVVLDIIENYMPKEVSDVKDENWVHESELKSDKNLI